MEEEFLLRCKIAPSCLKVHVQVRTCLQVHRLRSMTCNPCITPPLQAKKQPGLIEKNALHSTIQSAIA